MSKIHSLFKYDIKKMNDDFEEVVSHRKTISFKAKTWYNKVGKLFNAIKLSWNDEDYSYDYILTMLEEKMINTKNCIRSNQLLADFEIEKIEQQIDEALTCLNNYYNAEEVFDKLEDPFEKYNLEYKFKKLESGNYNSVIVYEGTMKEITKKIQTEINRYEKEKDKFEEYHFSKFWDCVKENIRHWKD